MNYRSKLVKMRITNIGCIGPEGLDVALDNIVCLVGANNAGKSTVLRAYEAALTGVLRTEEFHVGTRRQPASVELWVHIPEGAENIDEKWKEPQDGLLLVRSRWQWYAPGERVDRRTWDPVAGTYAEDDRAAGLDAVFSSRLPQPFRIGSLEDPTEEHKKLLELVLEPIKKTINDLMRDDGSTLHAKVSELRAEASKPVESYQHMLNEIADKVNRSYQRIFNAAEIKLNVSLGELVVDPATALSRASHIEVREPHGALRWEQQGTGSQRALFWSILEARSALTRLSETRKQSGKLLKEKLKEKGALENKLASLKKADAKERCQSEIKQLDIEIEALKRSGSDAHAPAFDPLLPGHMLLIDEPETALHPSAVRAAKEHLYALAAESGWQVMLSTHHPAFVDPLKDHTTIVRLHRPCASSSPNVYRADEVRFSTDERETLKHLLAFDSTVAEIFFGSRIILVEGDTELAAFSAIMDDDPTAFPVDDRPLIVRARGKGTIPIVIRMLAHFKVDFAVLHDIDATRERSGRKSSAYSQNTSIAREVAAARAAGRHVIHRLSCPTFEQHHGIVLTSKDKPLQTWRALRNNDAVKASVRRLLGELVAAPSSAPADTPNDGKHFEETLRRWAARHAPEDPRYSFG